MSLIETSLLAQYFGLTRLTLRSIVSKEGGSSFLFFQRYSISNMTYDLPHPKGCARYKQHGSATPSSGTLGPGNGGRRGWYTLQC